MVTLFLSLMSAILVGHAAKIPKSRADGLEVRPALNKDTGRVVRLDSCQTGEPDRTFSKGGGLPAYIRCYADELGPVDLSDLIAPRCTHVLHSHRCPTTDAKKLPTSDWCLFLMLVTELTCQDG
jgi:hypothetical protein